MKILVDFESRSEADLPIVGSWNYSLHKSTKALCVAISVDGEEPILYDLYENPRPPPE